MRIDFKTNPQVYFNQRRTILKYYLLVVFNFQL